MIGQTLAQYQIVEELGGGGMGLVYRARDTRLHRDVALKVLSPDRSVSDRTADQFLKEARAAAALRHPSICTVYDVGSHNGVWFISMAFIPGRSLKDVVEDGPMSTADAVKTAIQIAQGLQAAHDEDIVHRDIKSANVIVDDSGRATILDFGIAKLSSHATDSGEMLTAGTVAYMSPEQASGERVDQRSDIWSLGVCLYEMLTGQLPFAGDHDSAVIYQIINQNASPLTAHGVGVPRGVSRIVEKAMEKQPANRYQLIDEMLADLKLIQKKGGIDDTAHEPSVAVLPFSNMSADPNQSYFCEGMAEEVINALAQVDGLRVAARTSSFAFRDTPMDIREIGRKLGVDSLLEGSVQKAGNTLRITAQLINVSDGYHLWSQRYDRDLEDVFAIQDEIACSIVSALEITLTETERKVLERVPTTDMKAYDFYMRGLHHYHEMDREGLALARNLYTSAIIRDPGYALAYCGLADCYSMIYSFYDNHHSNVENGLTAAEKAIELTPDLAEAHASRGLALSLDGRFDEAEREFASAIDLRPKLFEAYYYHARACRAEGRLEEAAALFEKASEVRPEDYQALILGADTYRGLDRPDEMRRAFERGLQVAARHLELRPNEARAWYLGAHAHYELGNVETALGWNEQAMKLAPRDPGTLYNAGCLFSLAGELERCFECFNMAIDHGFNNRRWLENDPDLQAVRSDARYQALLDRMSGGPE